MSKYADGTLCMHVVILFAESFVQGGANLQESSGISDNVT